MNAIRLQSPDHGHPGLALSPGVHALGRDGSGRIARVGNADDAIAQLCIDRRGIWLQVRDGVSGLHVNGRPVRRMAMLRMGDAIYLDGSELLLVSEESPPAPQGGSRNAVQDTRMVLRGVGGPYHGRCFTLDRPHLVGRAGECDIRIDEDRFAERHAQLEAHAGGVALRNLESADGSVVNGWPVRDVLLQPGDQVVFGTQHRFVVEVPLQRLGHAESVNAQPHATNATEPRPMALPRSVRRMPWLLLAALLLACALSLLLLYGAR